MKPNNKKKTTKEKNEYIEQNNKKSNPRDFKHEAVATFTSNL